MKNVFFTAVLLTIITGMSAFARKNPSAPEVVLTSFHRLFHQAQQVQWSFDRDLYIATFLLKGQKVHAYYDSEGMLVASTRSVKVTELPLTLQVSLQKRAQGAVVVELMEASNNDGVTYYATVDTGKKMQIIRSGSSDWFVHSSKKK